MNFFFEVLIGGLLSGVMYALVALGFVLIYKATETVNFAQGELMMLGAFCGVGAAVSCGRPAVCVAVAEWVDNAGVSVALSDSACWGN